MITPENNIPADDRQNDGAEDQQSQQDIHSNGFDDEADSAEQTSANDADNLQQADAASEASFTLDVDKGIDKQNQNDSKDYNIKQ